MSQAQEQTGNGQETKAPPAQLPIDKRTLQMVIQTMAYQEERQDRLERRLDELTTRFNLWNASYKNFMQTMEAYMAAQAAKETRQPQAVKSKKATNG